MTSIGDRVVTREEDKSPAVPLALPQAQPRPAFLVTVDAECDNAWARSKDVTTVNAEYLPRFQALCEFYGIKPTYFANFEMASSPVFQEFGRDILKRGTGEIGMHLHAWNSPPFVALTADDFRYHPYLIEYPESVMRDKIAFMTDLLEDTFGVAMCSHRAGRWGFNETYARLLAARSYTCDCSVTPLTSWASHTGDPSQNGGPDYSFFPLLPYFLNLNDISLAGESSLLEIPVTAMKLRSGVLSNLEKRLSSRSLASRALNRAFPRHCLMVPTKGSLGLILRVLKKCIDSRRPCVQFALHSSNLMPNGSPFFADARDIEELYHDLHRLFSLAKRLCRGMTVSEFRSEFAGGYSAGESACYTRSL